MARLRRFDLDELATRPGTYFNPETEILIVVDDSAHPGAELAEDADAEWILVGDDVPLDDARRDEMLERLEVRAVRAGQPEDVDDDELVEEEDELEPDPDPDVDPDERY